MTELFDQISLEATALRRTASTAARALLDFKRRLQLILNQERRELAIRDVSFQQDFTFFCQQLRKETDRSLDTWQQLRKQMRLTHSTPSVLQAKSFSLRAKTLSRTSDELTTALDAFQLLYKRYTLSKLPVWVLTSCCDDVNYLSGKILFSAREVIKRAGLKEKAHDNQ